MPAKRTMPRVCERCGADFLVRPDQVRKGWGRFCKRNCNSQFWHQVDKAIECWEWAGDHTANGYGRLTVDGKRTVANRVALEMAMGISIPDGFLSLHTCDNPPCVRNDDPGIYVIRGIARPRFGHLWLGTHEDNVADAAEKGRMKIGAQNRLRLHADSMPKGTACSWSKLDEDDVRAIRQRYARGGVTQRQLATEYGLHYQTVWQIIHRERWSHLT
jgi:hypothetical protein